MKNSHNIPYEGGIIIHVTGKVQGVGFRFFTYQQAKKLNLVGYVKNLMSGEVEIVAYGSQIQINGLIDWLENGGPASAKIKSYHIKAMQPDENYTTFNVRY